jgi:hypothetical protein
MLADPPLKQASPPREGGEYILQFKSQGNFLTNTRHMLPQRFIAKLPPGASEEKGREFVVVVIAPDATGAQCVQKLHDGKLGTREFWFSGFRFLPYVPHADEPILPTQLELF